MDKSTNTSPLSKLAEIVVKKYKGLNKGQAYNIIINVRKINGGVLVGLSKSKFMEKVEQVVKEREEKNRQDAKRDENNKCRLKRTCPFCYRWFIEKFSRDRHIKICHDKSLKTKKVAADGSKCPTCAQHFRHKTSLVRHMKTHEIEVETFPCDQCDGTFSREDNLYKHRERKHALYKVSVDAIASSKSGFECKMCNLNFGTDREALETHVIKKACMDNDHSLDENGCYQCAECDKIFFDKNSLTRHSTGKHDKRLKRKFECTTCKQIFSYASTLKRHCLKFHKKA